MVLKGYVMVQLYNGMNRELKSVKDPGFNFSFAIYWLYNFSQSFQPHRISIYSFVEMGQKKKKEDKQLVLEMEKWVYISAP